MDQGVQGAQEVPDAPHGRCQGVPEVQVGRAGPGCSLPWDPGGGGAQQNRKPESLRGQAASAPRGLQGAAQSAPTSLPAASLPTPQGLGNLAPHTVHSLLGWDPRTEVQPLRVLLPPPSPRQKLGWAPWSLLGQLVSPRKEQRQQESRREGLGEGPSCPLLPRLAGGTPRPCTPTPRVGVRTGGESSWAQPVGLACVHGWAAPAPAPAQGSQTYRNPRVAWWAGGARHT